MKSFFLVALLLSSCSPISNHVPPTVGFSGTVKPTRDVYCVATALQCGYVIHAIDQVNAAAEFKVMRYAGRLSEVQAAEMAVGPRHDMTLVIASPIADPIVLGVTYCASTDGHYERVLVVLDPVIFDSEHEARSVTLHELFHAIGADHADPKSQIPSVEKPVYDPSLSPELQPGDITALRAAYPVP